MTSEVGVATASIRKSLGWTTFAKIIAQITTFASTLVLARLLVKADFGLFALALVYMALCDNLVDFGFQSSIIQRRDLAVPALATLYWMLNAVAIALCGLTMFAAPVVASFMREPHLSGLLPVLAAVLLFAPTTIVSAGVLSRDMRVDVLARIELVAALIRVTVTIGLAYLEFGVMSFALGYVAERGLIASSALIASRWQPIARFEPRSVLPLFSFGAQITIARLLWLGTTRIDVLVIGRILGTDTLGAYTIASQIAMAFFQFIASSYYRVVYPAFSRLQASSHRNAFVEKSSVYLALVALPVFGGIAAVAGPFVEVFLGAKWSASVAPLQVLALVAALQTMGGLLPQAANAIGRTDVGVRVNLVTLLVMASTFYLAAKFGGLEALLVTWCVVAPVRFLLLCNLACKALGISISHYAKLHLGPAVSCALMVAVVCATEMLLASLSAASKLAVEIAVAALSYLLGALWFCRPYVLAVASAVWPRVRRIA
ncbi:MAG: lipopolysaccharide biosynthesis protein [Gammaproteobacteria bacterium]|nr:lipopolysaccharide biosynthesis protein [Gammaproteobacteria bacterium]